MTGMLAHRPDTCRRQQQKKRLAGLEEPPVRSLASRASRIKFSNADHESGSCPATVRQHSPPGCLQAELRAVTDVSREEDPVGLEGAPVR